MKRPTLHKLIFSILLFAISFLALFTSHKSSAFADWYSSTIYPLFVSSIGRFFGIFQFSVSEIGLYIFVILLFLSLVRMLISSIYKMYAKKKNPAWLGYGSSLLLLSGCLFTFYTFFCGINYGHTSFAEKYLLDSGQNTQAELTSLCNELTDQLNTLSDSLGRDSNGLADMGKDLQDRARAAMFSFGATYPELSGYYPQPKGLLFPAFLSVQNLSSKYAPKIQNVSFDIRKGEIFGFYGLVGAGRTELLETIFGIRTRAEGNVIYDGKLMNFSSPRDAMDHGFALITEERIANGLFLKGDITFNTTIANMNHYKNGAVLSHDRMVRATAEEIKIMHTK